jgi:hypothetical protein
LIPSIPPWLLPIEPLDPSMAAPHRALPGRHAGAPCRSAMDTLHGAPGQALHGRPPQCSTSPPWQPFTSLPIKPLAAPMAAPWQPPWPFPRTSCSAPRQDNFDRYGQLLSSISMAASDCRKSMPVS